MDQGMTSAEQHGSPFKENEGDAAKVCSQDSHASQRPALQENAFQPLLTPGGPLALSPPRTLRSSQKWGSLSASRILGLSPNGRPRGRSLVLSPMCSRAAPASQGHQPQAGVEGVLPGVHMQDSSSLDFVPPRAARAVPPLGRMCHSQPCPLSGPWPDQSQGIPDNQGTPNETGEPSEPGRGHDGDVMGIQPNAAAAGAEAASDGRDIYAHASPSGQQATRPDAPNSAAAEQPDGNVGQPNMVVDEAGQQPAETSVSVQNPGEMEKDEDTEARMGLDEMGGTLGDGPSLQLNLSLGLGSQDDHIMPTEVEPKGFEVTARQLVATERELTGGFCPETQVEVALQVPAPITSFDGPAQQQPPVCPDTQILDCPFAPPAQAHPSPSAAQPSAPGGQRAPHQSPDAPLAPHAGATAYLLTEVQPTAVPAAEVEARAEAAAQPSVAAAPAAIHMPAQESRKASPPQLNAHTVDAASTAAASALVQERRDSAEEEPPGGVPGPMGSPPRSAGVQPSEQVVALELLDMPEGSKLAVEAPSPLRTPPSGRPSLSLTLLSEDFVSESEGTQRAVQAADIIHRYSYKCLLGDAVGGVFSSVLAADMEALAAGAGRKVSRTLSPETTRWERRLVEAWRDHELLGWDVDGPGDPETSGDPGGLTQEVDAVMCAEEEISSRREELERTGELRAVRAVREHVQVRPIAAPEAPRPACGAQPSAASGPGRKSHCLAVEAEGAAQITADSVDRACSAGAVVASGKVATDAIDEVAAVMEALVAAASACPSDQAAEAAAGQDPTAAKRLSDQATGTPASEEQLALPDADCAPMEIDSGDGGSACAAMQPEDATLEPTAAAVDQLAANAPAPAVPVHGKVASIVADEDDEDSPSLQLNLQLETQYPEQAQQHFSELVPDSEAANMGANGTSIESEPLAPARPPVSSTGAAPGPVPLGSSGAAQQGGTPASAGTLEGAADGGSSAAGPSHHLVPDSEAAGHSPSAAAAAPSEAAPVSTSGGVQQAERPALEGRVPAARSQDDVWGAILSISTQPSCGAGPAQKAPAWQPRSGPGIVAGERQANQSQPSPGARGWQREVGSSGLRLRPVWGSAPASREATPLTGDTLLTPPKRTLLGGPPSIGLTRPAASPGSPDTPSDVAATADVLHLYSRPLKKDIQTPESQRKRPRSLASESPDDMAARHEAACGEPEAGARVGRASPQSPDPSGSFVPDTYPGIGAGCGGLDEHAGHGNVGDEPVDIQEEEFRNVLPMNEERDVQPAKRRRLSLEGGRKDRQAEPVQERDSAKKGLHAMAVHAPCGRATGAKPMTRARADELASDARPRMTRLQEQKQKRKEEQLKAGRLHRAGQVRPISARKRRTSGVALKKLPAHPSFKRKREAAGGTDAPNAGEPADDGHQGPAAEKHAAVLDRAQGPNAAAHGMTGQDDVSEAGRNVEDQSASGAAAPQAAGGNMRSGRVRDPYSFPETQDVRLENPARGRVGLATANDQLHISKRSHAQGQAHVEGLAGSNLNHGAGRDGAQAIRNPSRAEPSHGPDAPQRSGNTAEANHGQGRWAPQRKRTALAAERATAGAAGAADRPQRTKRQPLRFEDYQQGSIAAQDTAEVQVAAPLVTGGHKAAKEAAGKAAGPSRRRLVRLSDLDTQHADNAGAHAPPEDKGRPRGMSGPADVEADGCDEDAGDLADSAGGQEGALVEEQPAESAANPGAQEREDVPRPALKPPKLGCSKCRYSRMGCGTCRTKAGAAGPLSASPKRISGPKSTRRASLPSEAPEPQPRSTRRASLPQEAPEAQQDIAAPAGRRQSVGRRKSEPALVHEARAGVLAGKAFLVTGFEEGAVRRRVHKLICDHGGSVIDSIPKGWRDVDGVVAGKACDRRAKYLFAHVTGAPALKASFLERCVSAGKWLPLRAADAWLPAREPRLVFHGFRVCLHGERGFVQQFGALLPHAGCVVVPEMEAPLDSPDPKRRRLLPPSCVGQPNCDLVIFDKADPLQAHSDLHNLLRQARRLTIPAKSVDWMIAALVSGNRPPFIPVMPLPQKRRTAPEPQQAAGNSSRPGEEAAAAQDAAPSAEAAEDGSGALVEDSESFGEPPFEIRPSLASVSFGGPGAAGPRSPQRAAEGHNRDGALRQLDHAAAMPGRRPAGQCALMWLGEPSKDPPAGLNMHASHHRTFYSAVAKGDAEMAVGDDVMVEMLGEEQPRVARLEALWSELPVDGCERLLARCRFYYRPSETSFMSSSKPNELFASDHVEQRLPASTLLHKCTVLCAPPGDMAAVLERYASLGPHRYFCLYRYDHLGEALKPVPAG
ncbi:hypothetical protein COCOBI_01-2140 [Coccomyxa sp. Obi]|nr:hypothetical protein COCOBI_01-2140 [Coccomyxa sp. Obi]